MELGINHQSPLIYCELSVGCQEGAGNQSPIPFDILFGWFLCEGRQLGINHQSPLIYCGKALGGVQDAGNQSPIPFDILTGFTYYGWNGWESITNPL